MAPLRKGKSLPFCCRLPYGAQPLMTEGVPLRINEGWIEEAKKEEGATRHSFLVAVAKDKLIPLFDALAAELGAHAYAIIELPPEDDGEEPGATPEGREGPVEVHLSAEFERQALLEGLAPYKLQLLLDGMIGFGLASTIHRGPPARVREIFVDEHKLLRIHDEKPEPWRKVLARFGLEKVEELHTVDLFPHVHQALDQFPENELPEPLRRAPLNELVWEEYIGNLLESLQFEKQSPTGEDAPIEGHPVHETLH